MSTLIKNATVITQNASREIIDNCDILIVDNKIEQIGRNLKTQNTGLETSKPETVIDATGKIAMPGLINMHTHVAMTLLRGLGEDLPLQQWLEKKIWPAEAKLTANDVYNGSMLGICEMLHSGVTCFNDMYIKEAGQVAKACVGSGIRGHISRGMFEYLPFTTPEKEFSDSQKFIKEWKGKSELVMPVVACHSVYMCGQEFLLKAKDFADKEKLKFHMHISETRKEIFDCLEKTKRYPLDYLGDLGILDENTILAHAGWVTKREIALAGKKKTTVVNCPISNLKLATGGICQITEFDHQGANVCLGTDSAASNNSLNMFETMKMSSLLQKHHYWNAAILPTQRILDFATINGARALGINAGSIEKGKLADIILLDGRMANMLPRNDLISNIVYSASPANVADVIVNGKIVMHDRVIQTVDEENILSRM